MEKKPKKERSHPEGSDDPIHGPTPLIHRKDGKVMRKQPTRAQQLMRVQQVVTWLLDGYTTRQAIAMGKDKWGLSTRPMEYMIVDAKEQIETMAATENKSALTLALLRLTELYDKAVKEGDNKTALDIVKTQNRMLGLNAPDKVEARAVENWDSMDVAQQLEHVNNILERAQKQPEELN
jgi:hypothetical protein